MKKKFLFLSLLGVASVILAFGTTARAAVLAANDTIKFYQGHANGVYGRGNNGGSFGVAEQVSDGAGNGIVANFTTFCVEENEYLDFSTTFIVTDADGYKAQLGGLGGGPADTISTATSYLYQHYVDGDIASLSNAAASLAGYSSTSDAWVNALQLVFWRLEDEISSFGSLAGATEATTIWSYLTAANGLYGTEGVAKANVSGGPVTVLNIKYSNGTLAQSQLYYPSAGNQAEVPEPATMVTWSVLAAFGFVATRFRRKKA